MTRLNDLVDGDDRPPIDAADAAEVFLFRDLGDEVTLGGAIHMLSSYHCLSCTTYISLQPLSGARFFILNLT